MKYNKLVRDKIPEILKGKRKKAVIHIANDEEYWKKLKEKLNEEVNEFVKDSNEEEIADIIEVINAICKYRKFDKNKLDYIKKEKAEKRGRFDKRIILDEVND